MSAPTDRSSRRPRLLVVGPLPPPVGGVETVTQAILESGAFRDFQLAHCDSANGRLARAQDHDRFDAGDVISALRPLARMRAAVARVRPDVAYLPVAGTWPGFLRDMALAWIARRSGARVIGHVHDSDFHLILERTGPSARWVRAGLDQLDCLLVPGEPAKRLVEAFGIRGRCAVVPSTFRREVSERGASFRRGAPRPWSVEGLFLGREGPVEGVSDLLAAVKRCKDMEVPFRLTLVGPDDIEGQWSGLLETRRQLGLEDVTEITGPLQGEALYDRFRIAEVFVMPSDTEDLMGFYEAGAFEMPVITTVGSIPELIVDGRNGLLVEPGRVEQIVQAIVRLVRNPEERAAMGRQLKQDIAAFHPDRVCARIADEVRTTLSKA